MLSIVLISVAALVAVFLVVVALQPSAYRIERSQAIHAPAAAIFPHVNDFSKWRHWSPWEKMDPELKRSHEGPAAGVGSSYGWEGNRQVGAGRMTITESRPDELIRIKLEFFKPMPGVCVAEFTFKPEGAVTRVSWGMTGTYGFMAKAFGLFVNMDKMIGRQFEQGLSNLETVVKAAR